MFPDFALGIEDDFEAFCYLSRHTASIDVSVYIGEEGPRLTAPSNPQGSKPNPVCLNDFLRERPSLTLVERFSETQEKAKVCSSRILGSGT